MLQQYYGGGIDALSGRFQSPSLPRGRRTASHGQHLNLFANLGFPKPKRQPPSRGGSLDLPSDDDTTIRVNVSGKTFVLTRNELGKFPESLLAKPLRAGRFYDFVRKDYFFDRSRIAFDSIYSFYQSRGDLVFPENFPEQLLMDEFYFYGLYEYIEKREQDRYVKPSQMDKEEVVPKYKWQLLLWRLLDYPETNLASKIVSIVSLLIISLSIIVMCLDTLPSLKYSFDPVSVTNQNGSTTTKTRPPKKITENEIFMAETFCIIYFTIEIVLRFIASPIKFKFWFKVMNFIDLLAILPYYIILGLTVFHDARVVVALRVFRLSRAFRVLKVSRYVSGMKVLGQTLREALSDLWMIAFLTAIGTLLFASCVYYFEKIWDPDTLFESIPLSLWWSVVTISTVGYGDMAPRTLAGKLVGSTCAISGVLLIAPLLPIIYERWQRYYKLDQEGKRIRASHKLLRDLMKKKSPAPRSEKESKRAIEAEKKKLEKQEKRERKVSETQADSKKTSKAEKAEKDAEEKSKVQNDDIVWVHIKRASLKRKESESNMMQKMLDGKTAASKNKPRTRTNSETRSRKGKETVQRKDSSASNPEKSGSFDEKDEPKQVDAVPVLFNLPENDGGKAAKGWNEPGPSNVEY